MSKPVFVISCPIDTYSGYGARSRDIVKAVVELEKYDVKVLPQRWGNTPFGFIKDNPDGFTISLNNFESFYFVNNLVLSLIYSRF